MEKSNNTYNFCPACGKHNEGGRYCSECGEYLEYDENVVNDLPDSVQKELEVIEGIIEKFEEEWDDVASDEEYLLSQPESEHSNPNYQAA